MVMMLPFVLAAIAVWFGLRGNRPLCLWLWLLTLAVYAAWCKYHMTDPMNISL